MLSDSAVIALFEKNEIVPLLIFEPREKEFKKNVRKRWELTAAKKKCQKFKENSYVCDATLFFFFTLDE